MSDSIGARVWSAVARKAARSCWVALAAALLFVTTPGTGDAFGTHLHAQAGPKNFLWKVSRREGVIYIAGSVHLLSARFYPLDPAFDTAFSASDLLVEELDLGEMLSPNSQMDMLNRGLLPAGQTLDQLVSAETMAVVTKKFAELGLPVQPMKQFKPWMLALTIQGLEWQKAGYDADLGLDKHFYDLAVAGGKRVQGLETVAFQVSRFDEMSMALQDRMLVETLKELETTTTSFEKLANAWKAGDVAGIESVVLQDLKAEPEMYKRLLVDRNLAWIPKIEALLARPRPAFVVVGAAHLVGTDGLLRLLAAKNYTIEQL
jgi:uncharacterized protein YbaP (TraB family)